LIAAMRKDMSGPGMPCMSWRSTALVARSSRVRLAFFTPFPPLLAKLFRRLRDPGFDLCVATADAFPTRPSLLRKPSALLQAAPYGLDRAHHRAGGVLAPFMMPSR